MKKPTSLHGLFALVFGIIGVIYMAVGALSWAFQWTLEEGELRKFSLSFGGWGLAFAITTVVLLLMMSARKKQRVYLLEFGQQAVGTVTAVKRRRDIHFGRQYPYTIYATWSHQGQAYKAKSDLRWEKPMLEPGNSVKIKFQPNNPKQYHLLYDGQKSNPTN